MAQKGLTQRPGSGSDKSPFLNKSQPCSAFPTCINRKTCAQHLALPDRIFCCELTLKLQPGFIQPKGASSIAALPSPFLPHTWDKADSTSQIFSTLAKHGGKIGLILRSILISNKKIQWIFTVYKGNNWLVCAVQIRDSSKV